MSKSNIYKALLCLFILVSIIEILAEFWQNYFLMSFIKPSLMPLIFAMYYIKVTRISFLYILALFINWISNILFISTENYILTTASILFIISRLFILKKVYDEIKIPTLFPLVIGTIPFLFMFIYFNFLIFNEINLSIFLLTLAHSVVMSIMGGISLGNYIMKNDKISKLLLISTIFYALNILLLGVKFYYLDLNFLKPISMIFFILGHFSLLQFVILSENERTNFVKLK